MFSSSDLAVGWAQSLSLLAGAFLLVGLLTPVMRKIAIRADIMDHPRSSHKTHKEPTPYLGGAAIIIGIVLITYAALLIEGRPAPEFWVASSLLIPATVLGLIGLVDDVRELSPLPRFIAQTIAGVVTAAVLIATDTVGNPTGNSAIDAFITVVWVVGITNSINFFDNLDGGAAGAVAATSLGTFLIARDNGQSFIAALAALTFGAMLGFLLWNKSPARIYMGDAGALFLGVLVSVMTLRLDPAVGGKLESFSIPLLLLAIPILDTCVAVFSRLRRGISPFQGGRDHLSHRLIRFGLSKRNAAFALWGIAGGFAVVANVIAHSRNGAELLVALTAALWFGLFILFYRTRDAD